jgi:hypothetical protein
VSSDGERDSPPRRPGEQVAAQLNSPKTGGDDDSGPRQLPDAQDLVLRRFADRVRRNGNDGGRLACGREDLELVALSKIWEARTGRFCMEKRLTHPVSLADGNTFRLARLLLVFRISSGAVSTGTETDG